MPRNSRVAFPDKTDIDVNVPPAATDSPWATLATSKEAQKEVAIGDLHGNFMKLIWSLKALNVIQVENAKYAELARLEQEHFALLLKLQTKIKDNENFGISTILTLKEKARLTQQIAAITRLINGIKVTRENKDVLVRLIGDVIADRGANDYLTLYLIDHLRNQGLEFKVSLSNHDNFCLINDITNCKHNNQGRSCLNTIVLVEQGIIKQETIAPLFHNYIQCIEPISYSIETDARGKITQLNIFNHAIAGPECLKALIEKYSEPGGFLQGVKYKIDSIEDICTMIDAINKKFRILITTDTAAYTSLIQAEEVQISGDLGREADYTKAPLSYLFWNRKNHEKMPGDPLHSLKDTWPVVEGVRIIPKHGHVGQDGNDNELNQQKTNGANLDGHAGRHEPNHDGHENSYVMPGKNPLFVANAYPSFAVYKAAYPAILAEPEPAKRSASASDHFRPKTPSTSLTAPQGDFIKNLDDKFDKIEQIVQTLCPDEAGFSPPQVERKDVGKKSIITVDDQDLMEIKKTEVSAYKEWADVVPGVDEGKKIEQMAEALLKAYKELAPPGTKTVVINGKDTKLCQAIAKLANKYGLEPSKNGVQLEEEVTSSLPMSRAVKAH